MGYIVPIKYTSGTYYPRTYLPSEGYEKKIVLFFSFRRLYPSEKTT